MRKTAKRSHAKRKTETRSKGTLKPFSVLLLYTDSEKASDSFYTFVKATGAIDAVRAARRHCEKINEFEAGRADEYPCLLVIDGYRMGLETEE